MQPAELFERRRDLHTKAVALTFDDGPSEWTEEILDVLRDAEARATFFVIGDAIVGREETLRRMVAEGHEVANHTATHARLDLLATPGEIEAELRAGSRAIEDVTGVTPEVFRPPGCNYTPQVLEVAGACGFRWLVLTGVAMADFNMTSPKKIARRVLWRVRRGSIITLHDGKPPHEPPHSEGGSLDDRSAVADAVRLVVPALVRRGYSLRTVSELISL
jgi:peptidoglycan-N-acetylglucosamine deacetylase